jgi:UDP-N-acetylglucosamine acyltransferase
VGERPQHLVFADAPGRLEIGAGNIFRENVTIHRGTPEGSCTSIGNENYFMCGSHVAHDCAVGNQCLFVNGALIGGHVEVQDRAILSGNTAVHQHCRVGRLAMLSGTAYSSKDVPPFALLEGRNRLVGVNLVGLKRAGLSQAQIQAIRMAYRLLLQPGLLLQAALTRIEKELAHIDTAAEIVKFIRSSGRGICTTKARRGNGDM